MPEGTTVRGVLNVVKWSRHMLQTCLITTLYNCINIVVYVNGNWIFKFLNKNFKMHHKSSHTQREGTCNTFNNNKNNTHV